MLVLGEFIHVSAIYLGLAVLTTLGLSLVLPSMREQSQQFHEAVLAMFQNPPASDVLEQADVPEWAQFTRPDFDDVASSLADAFVQHKGADDDGAAVAGGSASLDGLASEGQTRFAQALAESLSDEPVPGISAAQRHGLGSYLARKYQISRSVADALLRTAFMLGDEMGLDPQLILAVAAIESRYNPFAESPVGAQGLMQVMTRVHRDKLQAEGGVGSVFDPGVNMRVGGRILADCMRRRGSVAGGLACYVGATGPSDGGYGAKVLAERRRMALASGLAPVDRIPGRDVAGNVG
ncbi:transglycosylase SLT domain-containing protein [Castellaniella sp.]|uniref:lytic transglycosylase domain-containing protein n=1 Tax=Castellaniella sp. TaxID=1955812 RepID=UPI00355D76FD